MSARKRRNRPGRRAPSRRPPVRPSEPTAVEPTGEADAASPVEQAETQGTEPAEPAPSRDAASAEVAEVEGSAEAAQEAEASEAAASGAETSTADSAAREAEEPARTAVEAEPEPWAAEPEILQPEAAERERADTAERETEVAEPEAEATVAADLEEQPTEAQTTVAASEPAKPLAEPEEAGPEPGALADREDRQTETEPELREGLEAEPEVGFEGPGPAKPLALGPQAEAEAPAPPRVPAAEPSEGAAAQEPAARNGWAVLLQMGKPRLTKANLFAAILAVGLGFAVVAQVQQTQNAGLESLREDELVRILDDFTQDNLRLGNEIQELESSRDRLISGAGTSSEALRAAQERADTLGILAGTRPARGEGIELTIADPTGKITAPLLLDALEELRDAGAEAVQIGGIRVVASSYFTDVDGGIELSGQRLERPYTILAIGDSSTLASAMKIPGGVVDTVRGKDGIASITEKPQIDITALHVVPTPQYAQPVPSPTGS